MFGSASVGIVFKQFEVINAVRRLRYGAKDGGLGYGSTWASSGSYSLRTDSYILQML